MAKLKEQGEFMESSSKDNTPAKAQPKTPSQPPAADLGGTQAFQPAPPGGSSGFQLGDMQSTQAHVPTRGPSEATQTPAPASPLAKSGIQEQKIQSLGDYRLVKKLGAGGMGAVYKATQISLERDAAVKVLFKHLAEDPSFVERFQREARIMAKLDHPNVLRCYGVGEQHGWHFFAMEYIDGGSMESWLQKLGRLSVGDALYVIIACAEGLQHAHEQNMIHRDIKPDNILLTKKGVVKVADMGLAKAREGENVSLTRTGTGAGTPLYMSPEQARDAKHVDQRTDIYSLGCMLYTFLTGKQPFQGETYVELLEAKEKGKYPPAKKTNPEVPERLDLIIDKMLVKELKFRYESCAQVIKDLRELGLANKTLSFFETDTATAMPAAGTKTGTVAPKSTAVAPKVPAKAGAGPKGAVPAPAEKEDRNWWYVSYETKEGKLVNRKCTTAQVKELLKDKNFDLKAQVSHNKDGPYRSLATVPEFEAVLRGRIVKAKTERRANKMQGFYEQLEVEHVKRERQRWFRNLFLTAGGFVKLIIYLAVLAALAVGLYFGIKYGIGWIQDKFMGGAD
jgi:serine/threonine-protein kinase